jgi:hypothetical protein
VENTNFYEPRSIIRNGSNSIDLVLAHSFLRID